MYLIKYLMYVLKHKWFVGIELIKRKHYWLALVHDLSKLTPKEFIPYATWFFKINKSISAGRDKSGSYNPYKSKLPEFEMALFWHLHGNKHHWQYWVLAKNKGVKTYEIPDKYIDEMICDWIGAGKAQKTKGIYSWYSLNSRNMVFTRTTRNKIRALVKTFKPLTDRL